MLIIEIITSSEYVITLPKNNNELVMRLMCTNIEYGHMNAAHQMPKYHPTKETVEINIAISVCYHRQAKITHLKNMLIITLDIFMRSISNVKISSNEGSIGDKHSNFRIPSSPVKDWSPEECTNYDS